MRVVAFSLFLLLSAVCAPAMAQSTALEENQKAVIVLDVRLDSIRNSDLAKQMNLAEKLSTLQGESDQGIDPATLDRIQVALSAPENMESAMTLQFGQLPMEFFAKMVFNDEAAVEKFVNQIKEDSGGTVENDGKTYYKPPAEVNGPEGLLMHQVDAKTVEVGTEAYLFRTDRKVFTDNLTTAAESSPAGAVRLAIDLSGAEGLVSEMITMGKQQAPDPTVEIYMELIDNMKDIAISLDVSGGDLLSIKATGVDAAQAQELKEGLDSLLGMAKIGIQGMLPMIRQQDADGAAVVEKLADSLNATNEDIAVSIKIPMPEGFEDWVVKQVNQLPIFGGDF